MIEIPLLHSCCTRMVWGTVLPGSHLGVSHEYSLILPLQTKGGGGRLSDSAQGEGWLWIKHLWGSFISTVGVGLTGSASTHLSLSYTQTSPF